MSDAQEQTPDRTSLRQAAQWLARLHPAAEPHADAFRECERWRACCPANELAWQRAQLLSSQLGTLPPALARSTLNRKISRRKALTAIGAACVALPAGFTIWRALPWWAWTAEYRTATGEQRSLQLADGSLVQMNTNSAVDIAFDPQLRHVVLRSGEIMVRTAPDAQQPIAPRPFMVSSEAGTIRTLNAQFTARQEGSHCRVAVLEGAVEVIPAHATHRPVQVAAGQCLRFSVQDSERIQPLAAGESAWVRGVLVAENMRLTDFLDELARYRPGILRCSSAVANLRISGGFQLQDTDRILSLLPATLPVRIVSLTRYWVSVEPRTAET